MNLKIFSSFFILSMLSKNLKGMHKEETNVTHCYYCNGDCTNPEITDCQHEPEKIVWMTINRKYFGCCNLRVIDTNEVASNALRLNNSDFDKYGFHLSKTCVFYDWDTARTCEMFDNIDGNSCIMCVENLCNWLPSGHVMNHCFLPIVIIFLIIVVAFYNIL